MQARLVLGKEATSAWHALHPQARQVAWAAARQGVAPPDPGLAIVAAGYGQTMARRLWVALLVAGPVFVVSTVVAMVALFVAGVPLAVVETAIPIVVVGFIAARIVLRVQRRRFQQLYSSGLLGMQSVMAGAPAPARGPAGPTDIYQSTFTVPYQRPVGYPMPAPPPASGYGVQPGHQGVPVEIRVRQRAIVVSLAVFGAITAFFWLVVLCDLRFSASGVLVRLVVVLMVVDTAAFLVLVVRNLRLLARPVIARFDPDGWQLSLSGMHGGWDDVREIRVRTGSARRTLLLRIGSPTLRIIALVVDEPGRFVEQITPRRRAAARRTLRRFGSPIAIAAGAQITVDVVTMLAILRRYTAAPVNWGADTDQLRPETRRPAPVTTPGTTEAPVDGSAVHGGADQPR